MQRAATAPSPRRSALLFGLGAVALAVLYVAYGLAVDYVVDDSYIAFQYAKNLAAGHGPVYIPGERVEGYTDFLWVLLVAGWLSTFPGADPLPPAQALGLASGALCVLLTGPGEEKTRDEVTKAAKHPLAICDEGSPTIASLKATVSVLDLLVCNDSGPRHVAVAFNKPVICIMGPTAPVYTEGPYERGRVLRVDVDCGPCQKPVCATDHRCMLNISPDDVLEAALEYLPKAKV